MKFKYCGKAIKKEVRTEIQHIEKFGLLISVGLLNIFLKLSQKL